MSIYARYFDQETLVHSVDELIDFLMSIQEIHVTQQLINDVQAYVESDIPYPKRYKIRPRVYFILIKSNAETMEEFRANNRKKMNGEMDGAEPDEKDERMKQLTEEKFGWYRCALAFKRVIQIPETLKYEYQDNEFVAFIKGSCPLECYNRAVDYLQARQDIDQRSQYPSAKNPSFTFQYIGDALSEAEVQEIDAENLTSYLI